MWSYKWILVELGVFYEWKYISIQDSVLFYILIFVNKHGAISVTVYSLETIFKKIYTLVRVPSF